MIAFVEINIDLELCKSLHNRILFWHLINRTYRSVNLLMNSFNIECHPIGNYYSSTLKPNTIFLSFFAVFV